MHSIAERIHSVAERMHSIAERMHSIAERMHPIAERMHPIAERIDDAPHEIPVAGGLIHPTAERGHPTDWHPFLSTRREDRRRESVAGYDRREVRRAASNDRQTGTVH
jgi:hypothetical protein